MRRMAERDDPTTAPGLRLGAVLGSGAVATVLRVEAADGRVFAGKLLHESHGQDSAALRRFAQEAALLRDVHDPNIVEVYIRHLRNKIDRPFQRDSIETVRGVGYRFAELED